MKICYVHNEYRSLLPSGENVSVLKDYESLKRNRVDAHLITLKSDDFIETNFFKKMWTLIHVLVGVYPPKRIRKDISRIRPDICHFHNFFPLVGMQTFKYLHRRKIKVVVTIHNVRLNCLSASHFRSGRGCFKCSVRKGHIPGIFFRCFKGSAFASTYLALFNFRTVRALKYVDQFIVLNKFSMSMLESAGVGPEKISIRVPIPSRFQNAIKLKEKRILFAGRLSEEKGIRLLMKAWKHAGLSNSGWTLVVAGSGELEGEVTKVCDADSSVEFLGYVTQNYIDEELAKASAICVPSLGYEGFPTLIAQSSQFGICALVTNINSFQDFEESWLIKCETDINSLAEALRTLENCEISEKHIASQLWYEKKRKETLNARDLMQIYTKTIEVESDYLNV